MVVAADADPAAPNIATAATANAHFTFSIPAPFGLASGEN
jgi:hypothetical protein